MSDQQQFEQIILDRKDHIKQYLKKPLKQLAKQLVPVWGDSAAMNAVLAKAVKGCDMDHVCKLIYAVDEHYIQVSDTHAPGYADNTFIGQDLSQRAYFLARKKTGFSLSEIYVSKQDHRSCITAVKTVRRNKELLGYVCADMSPSVLLQDGDYIRDRKMGLQLRGDPSIRGTLFMQTRTFSEMDQNIDDVIAIIEELLLERGVFHAKLHFSSSRSTLWLYADPYRYRVHPLHELLSAVSLAYPRRPYPREALVDATQVHTTLARFRALREADEVVYLRAASLNIINGQVSLNFSCDGSYYMPAEEFLDKGLEFWFGQQ
jgi:hypothetical protein